MTITLYLQCTGISLLGLLLSILLILKSQLAKARLANVIFPWNAFWRIDLWVNMGCTLVWVAICLMLLGPAIKQFPKYADNSLLILIIFAAQGYLGSDVASRFFSAVNSRINAAIDFKTTQADTASGNLGAPTPAMKPNKNA